jgi:hypothetical protein
MKMKYESADIVRFKHEKGIDGLFEVIEDVDEEGLLITNDEYNSERYAYKKDLIYVCSVKDRKDI